MTPTPTLDKVLRFFNPFPPGSPCLGLALGRSSLWAVCAREERGKKEILWSGKYPLEGSLFSAAEDREDALLQRALEDIRNKTADTHPDFQLALPDPAVRVEVFELDKTPSQGGPLREFLSWRFNPTKVVVPRDLSFASQFLGSENSRSLLLAEAVEKGMLKRLVDSLRRWGLEASVTDSALGYRFNFFHDVFAKSGGTGALLTFETEYWSLAVWDREIRMRFARSKWLDREAARPEDLPLEEILREAERTIHSYVYSNKQRSVETVFVLAPEGWQDPIIKALDGLTGGRSVGLSMDFFTDASKETNIRGVPPSAVTAAVRR